MAGMEKMILQGVRVVDASRVLAGPFCGQLLGDLGAEVIKVERPGKGDDTRFWGPPFVGDFSAYYLSCNRNKKSLALDLSTSKGKEIFYELVRRSDVVLENFLPEGARKLGLGVDQLFAVNPQLVICSISGFGRTGPMKDLPGYDLAIQARSGLMSITGPEEGPPYKVGVALTDILTGLYASSAVLACLHGRQHSGHGYAIDLALLDCALAAQVNVAQAYLATGEVPPRQGNAHLQIVPYQPFQTADDWLILAVGNDAQWQRFCQAAGLPELAENEHYQSNALRVQHREKLIPIVEKIMRQKSSSQWQMILREHDIPYAPVWNYAQLFAQDQIAERGMRISVTTPEGKQVDLVGSPFHIKDSPAISHRAPPRVGQDTRNILAEILAMPEDKIAELQRQGVVGGC